MGKHGRIEPPWTDTSYICAESDIPENHHHRPTIIRWWPHDSWDASNTAIVDDWDNGCFTVPSDHPYSEFLQHSRSDTSLTVESTDEYEWKPYRWSWTHSQVSVRCEPRLQALKNAVHSDAFLIELWLKAEQDYVDTYLHSQKAHCG